MSTQDLINRLRKSIPKSLAEDIVSVQPMDVEWFHQWHASKKGWRLMAESRVDDQQWYKVYVFDPAIHRWLFEQDLRDWSTVPEDHTVDISERLYTLFLLRWS